MYFQKSDEEIEADKNAKAAYDFEDTWHKEEYGSTLYEETENLFTSTQHDKLTKQMLFRATVLSVAERAATTAAKKASLYGIIGGIFLGLVIASLSF
jgi:hypothetical protein